jgi:hypothetical protein
MALTAVVALCWAVAGNNPSTSQFGQFLPKCLLHSSTGLHCTGCGLTRSVHAWLNGDWQQGLAYHTLSFFVLPLLAWLLVRGLWRWVWADPTVPPPPRRRLPGWLTWTFVVTLIAFSILRNIPVFPLTLLAPHEVARPTPEEPPPADPPAE